MLGCRQLLVPRSSQGQAHQGNKNLDRLINEFTLQTQRLWGYYHTSFTVELLFVGLNWVTSGLSWEPYISAIVADKLGTDRQNICSYSLICIWL